MSYGDKYRNWYQRTGVTGSSPLSVRFPSIKTGAMSSSVLTKINGSKRIHMVYVLVLYANYFLLLSLLLAISSSRNFTALDYFQ